MTGEVVIIGVGSILMGDDGVGVRVARELAGREVPPDVRVVDGGLMGVDLLFELEDVGAAVIVDAAHLGAEPGTVRVLSPDDMRLAGLDRLGGAHAVGVDQVLAMLQVLGHQPELRLVCVQPASVGPGEGLSPEVEAAVPAAADAAIEVARGLLT